MPTKAPATEAANRPASPAWMTPVLEAVAAKTANVFCFHGNVRDYPDSLNVQTLSDGIIGLFRNLCETQWVHPVNVISVILTQTSGMVFSRRTDVAKLNIALQQRFLSNQASLGRNPKEINITQELGSGNILQIDNPDDISFTMGLGLINELLQSTLPETGLLVIIDHAHLAFPASSTGFSPDATPIEMIRQWSSEPRYRYTLEKDATTGKVIGRPRSAWVALISDDVSSMTTEISQFPTIRHIKLPLPALAERERRLNTYIAQAKSKDLQVIEPVPVLARAAAGLRAMDLESVVWTAASSRSTLNLDYLNDKKREYLEDRYNSVLSPVTPKYGFEVVGGHEAVKNYAYQLRDMVRDQEFTFLPSGLLLTGPAGCQPAGSKVLMADMTWKNVEDVVTGDLVVSPQHDGTSIMSRVTGTVVYEGRDIYKVTASIPYGNNLRGSRIISYRCADNHIVPFGDRISGDWKEVLAREVTQDHQLNGILPCWYEGEMYKVDNLAVHKEEHPETVYGFTLDSPSEWYVTDDWIVTHNTGKTLIIQAMAKEIGFQMVTLDPDKTYNSLLGETEKNMRRAMDCIQAMAPCIVFIDEVDQAFMRGAMGDAGVSQRIFKMVLEFMANPENHARGILFAAATNQPKTVDAALTRPGRFGDIIPVLPPRSGEGRWQIVKGIVNQLNLGLEIDDEVGIEICGTDLHQLYTGAEIKEVVVEPLRWLARTKEADPHIVTETSLRQGFEEVKPSTRDVFTWSKEAVETASKRSFIPPEYLNMTKDKALVSEDAPTVEDITEISRNLFDD